MIDSISILSQQIETFSILLIGHSQEGIILFVEFLLFGESGHRLQPSVCGLSFSVFSWLWSCLSAVSSVQHYMTFHPEVCLNRLTAQYSL